VFLESKLTLKNNAEERKIFSIKQVQTKYVRDKSPTSGILSGYGTAYGKFGSGLGGKVDGDTVFRGRSFSSSAYSTSYVNKT
jgi:hypothetical protein